MSPCRCPPPPRYPPSAFAGEFDRFSRFFRDYLFLCRTRLAARALAAAGSGGDDDADDAARVYLYQFCFNSTWLDMRVPAGFKLREKDDDAPHGPVRYHDQ